MSSSALMSVGYSEAQETLEIEFPNGAVYQYYGVPAQVYEQLMNAESHGRYFHRHIRNSGYDYERIE